MQTTITTTTNYSLQPQMGMMQTSNFNPIWIDTFIKWAQVTPTTFVTYLKSLHQFLEWLKDNDIQNPTDNDALAYADFLKATKKPTTTQSYLNACKQFFKFCNQFGYYENIFRYVKGAKIDFEHHKKDALTLEQVATILEQYHIGADADIKTLRDYSIILLLCSCGLRTIEIERANIGDIINNGNCAYMYVQGKGRTEKAEKIEIPKAVYEMVQRYLQMRKETNSNAPLFISLSNHDYGKAMTKNSVSRVVKTAMRNVGINNDRLTAHSCRHFAITQALTNGNDVRMAQQMARHKNVNTTLIYAHDLERSNNHCETSVCASIMEQLKKA